MDKKQIERINELAMLARKRPLTEDELAEQAALREQYIKEFRAKLRGEQT